MLGLAAYGSDGSDTETTPRQNGAKGKVPSTSSLLSLPSPSNKPKPKRTIFTVAKPSKTSHSDGENDEAKRPSKKPKLASRKGAGSSSLIAMLPAPSKATPSSSKSAGSLGRNNKTEMNSTFSFSEETSSVEQEKESARPPPLDKPTPLLPPSLARSKARPKGIEKTSLAGSSRSDFFSLGNAPTSALTNENTKSSVSVPATAPNAISAAPTVTEFRPPSPTPLDPYPGYYQTPSGQWVAYDPEYYKKYWEAWATAAGVNPVTERGFEGLDNQATVEVDAQDQLNLTEKEREEKKALTKNTGEGRKEPRMNIKAANISSLAKTRHQLSSLLTDAYTNRQALEEKIAQGRRNRKEAGNKYGF